MSAKRKEPADGFDDDDDQKAAKITKPLADDDTEMTDAAAIPLDDKKTQIIKFLIEDVPPAWEPEIKGNFIQAGELQFVDMEGEWIASGCQLTIDFPLLGAMRGDIAVVTNRWFFYIFSLRTGTLKRAFSDRPQIKFFAVTSNPFTGGLVISLLHPKGLWYLLPHQSLWDLMSTMAPIVQYTTKIAGVVFIDAEEVWVMRDGAMFAERVRLVPNSPAVQLLDHKVISRNTNFQLDRHGQLVLQASDQVRALGRFFKDGQPFGVASIPAVGFEMVRFRVDAPPGELIFVVEPGYGFGNVIGISGLEKECTATEIQQSLPAGVHLSLSLCALVSQYSVRTSLTLDRKYIAPSKPTYAGHQARCIPECVVRLRSGELIGFQSRVAFRFQPMAS